MTLDLRFALRHFRRTPIITITMVLVLSLGIGINSALFTVLSGIFRRQPGGIPHDRALVWIRTMEGIDIPVGAVLESGASAGRGFPGLMSRDASYPEYQEFAAQSQLFSAVGAFATSDVVFQTGTEGAGSTAVEAQFVSPNFFSTLGVRPAMGAGLPATDGGDAAASLVVVISDAIWRYRFGGAPDVIGKTVRMNGVAFVVSGVAPPRFKGPSAFESGGMLVWAPLASRPAVLRGDGAMVSSRDSAVLTLFARLQPGVSADRATPTVAAIARRSRESAAQTRPPAAAAARVHGSAAYPTEYATADVVPLLLSNRSPEVEEPSMQTMGALMGSITVLVLVIICLNVSALLVGSAFGRRGEMAIRLSLGAPRRRIVRQLLTESAMVAVAGGLLGLLLLLALIHVTSLLDGMSDVDLSVGWDTVMFTLAFAVATGLLFGISPALHATGISVAEAMKQSGASIAASRSRLQRGFVVAQIALTQPLLVGLGILLGDVVQQMGGNAPGVRDHVIAVEMSWLSSRPGDTTGVSVGAMEERFRTLPGVLSVVRGADGYTTDRFSVHPDDRGVGATDARMDVRRERVAPGYFALMDIPIVRGRDFTADELRSGQAAIIGSDLARKLWGTTDPIGKRFQAWQVYDEPVQGSPGTMDGAPPAPRKPRDVTIVGMVDADKVGKSSVDGRTRVYVPVKGTRSLLVRSQGPGEAMVPTLRAIASKEFPQQPLSRVRTLAQMDATVRRDLLQGSAITAGAGILILLLASIGLYGVVAFAVGQRTREIGIRIALGASPRTVVRMFFGSGVALGGIGLLIGLPLSVAAMRLLASTVTGPTPVAVVPVAIGIGGTVIAVSSLATWLPARRAARVDPLVALRAE